MTCSQICSLTLHYKTHYWLFAINIKNLEIMWKDLDFTNYSTIFLYKFASPSLSNCADNSSTISIPLCSTTLFGKWKIHDSTQPHRGTDPWPNVPKSLIKLNENVCWKAQAWDTQTPLQGGCLHSIATKWFLQQGVLAMVVSITQQMLLDEYIGYVAWRWKFCLMTMTYTFSKPLKNIIRNAPEKFGKKMLIFNGSIQHFIISDS